MESKILFYYKKVTTHRLNCTVRKTTKKEQLKSLCCFLMLYWPKVNRNGTMFRTFRTRRFFWEVQYGVRNKFSFSPLMEEMVIFFILNNNNVSWKMPLLSIHLCTFPIVRNLMIFKGCTVFFYVCSLCVRSYLT